MCIFVLLNPILRRPKSSQWVDNTFKIAIGSDVTFNPLRDSTIDRVSFAEVRVILADRA